MKIYSEKGKTNKNKSATNNTTPGSVESAMDEFAEKWIELILEIHREFNPKSEKLPVV